LLLLLSGLPGVATAGGQLSPTDRPAVDVAAAADLQIAESGPSTVTKTFAFGGRFVGDLDGDGTDDIALPSGNQDRIELVFGGGSWIGEREQRSAVGDSSLTLPTGCRRDDRIHFAAAGDLDGDGLADLAVACPGDDLVDGSATFHGSVLLYFGRGTWGSTVSTADAVIRGVADDDPDPEAHDLVGLRVAGIGDVDGDGRDDLAITGASLVATDEPRAWVLLGADDAETTFDSTASAEWLFAGADNQRCLADLDAAGLGDIDGDGLDDFALYCGEEPNLLDTPPNAEDMAFLGFRAVDLALAGPGALTASDASFRSGLSPGLRPQASPHAALGDVSGDGIDDAWWPTFFDLEGVGRPSGRVLLGQAGGWPDITQLDPLLPPFEVGEGGFDHPDGLQLAFAGPLLDDGPMLWIRSGLGEDAQVGLLPSADPSLWEDSDVPPVVSSYVLPDGAVPGAAWRLGIGGPGDADGDGVLDLLVTGGLSGDGCEPLTCGAAWLILCRDGDEDGISGCAGDCDDADPGISPALPEQCDAIDHDCDGDAGQDDGDGDGILGCEGDCDDNDATRFPGAAETCDDLVDLDCDGLTPDGDRDGDGSINCEDCQPWLPGVFPLAEEVCDGLDTDCNGSLPPEEQDIDQDGVRGCAETPGDPIDCDDLDPFVHPFRHEDCDNGRDDDCDEGPDGSGIDEPEDRDADQVTTCQGDCGDLDDTIFPGAEELCDGLDNDCDGVVDEGRDMDGDGVSRCQGDCDDNDGAIFPGAVGHCDPALDGNCDGQSDIHDNDGDGLTACGGDCDDQAESTRPEATDWCDRVDNDCDGVVDGPFDTDGDGWATCLGDCDDGLGEVHPAIVEPACDDGVDGDCDRAADDIDSDCPVPEPVEPLPHRPYGLSCLDCSSSVGGGGGVLLVLLPLIGRRRRRRTRVPVAAVLVIALLLPAAAHAARKEQALVLYLSRLPDLRAMTAATKLADGANISAVEVLHQTELLEPTTGLVVHGALSQSVCPEETLPPVLTDASSEALDLLIGLDYEGARALLDDAIGRLPCLDKPLPRRILADLLYYRGVVLAGLGDEGAAGSDFSRLLAMEPEYGGDPNFPPDVNELLAGVRQARQRQEPAKLLAYAPTGARVRIDGVERTDKGMIELAPGLHVLQIVRGRDLGTAVVEIEAGSEVIAIHADDRLRALREVEASQSARGWARAVLGEAVSDAELELLAVIDLEVNVQPVRYLFRDSTRKFSFEEGFEGDGRRTRRPKRTKRDPRATARNDTPGTSTGATAETSTGTTASTGGSTTGTTDTGTTDGGTTTTSGSARSPAARAVVNRADPEDGVDRLRIRVGGGFAWVNPFPYGQAGIDISIRIVEGLVIDLGGEAATPGPTPYGLIWLPSASVGASWRFGSGPVQPRLGGLFKASFDSTEGELGVLPGGVGRFGLDFVPPNSRPLVLALDIQVGVVRDAFYASGGGSLGLRF
jgi:hypothetical protein